MFKKGVNTDEVSNFLIEKITNANIQSKLTIIDAYFFSNSQYSITDLLDNILEPFKNSISIIEIVTFEQKINQENYKSFIDKFKDFEVKVFSSQDFHDRFWIIDDSKAFIVGASMNGIGNKHFFIQDDYLTQNDCNDLLNLYKGEQL